MTKGIGAAVVAVQEIARWSGGWPIKEQHMIPDESHEMSKRLTVDWHAFGEAIRSQAIVDAKHITRVGSELGLSHARMVNAAQGKPVGTEIFLTLCHWMRQDPMHFARTSQGATHDQSHDPSE